MDTIGKLVATFVANSGQDDKKDKINSVSWPLTIRTVESAVNSFVKDMLGSEETWMVTQAKRRREKDDVYKKYPSMDPVFMKI